MYENLNSRNETNLNNLSPAYFCKVKNKLVTALLPSNGWQLMGCLVNILYSSLALTITIFRHNSHKRGKEATIPYNSQPEGSISMLVRKLHFIMNSRTFCNFR